jgi:fatty acid desaturase
MTQFTTTPLTQALAEGILTRNDLRGFMARSNIPAMKRLIIWLLALFATGSLVYISKGTLWVIPAMFIHGILLVHHFSLQHECVHYTVFRSRWLNDLVGNICGLIIILANTHFRYEHCDHHTFTQHADKDPELIPLPKSIWFYLLYLTAIPYWKTKITEISLHLFGRTSDQEKRFIPKEARQTVANEARLMVMIYLLLWAAMIVLDWWEPIWYWFIPLLLGEPVMRFVRMTEHVGRPNVAKMRENTRTNIVSLPWRFLCWNMNYHAEHHYASSVPFHALPRLHEKIKSLVYVEPGGYLGAHRDILAQVFGKQPDADLPDTKLD